MFWRLAFIAASEDSVLPSALEARSRINASILDVVGVIFSIAPSLLASAAAREIAANTVPYQPAASSPAVCVFRSVGTVVTISTLAKPNWSATVAFAVAALAATPPLLAAAICTAISVNGVTEKVVAEPKTKVLAARSVPAVTVAPVASSVYVPPVQET